MPLDTSSYSLALLRVDGRRWNELRRCHAQIRTQAAADGSSYLEMGNTKVMCVVTGPTDQQSARRAGGGGGGGQRSEQDKEAEVAVSIVIAGFSSVDRKRRGRGDNTITFSLHVLSQDGSLLAALINACALAAVDAGIPMTDYVAACTAGSTSTHAAGDEGADPLLDLNHQEEQELPSLTVATLGGTGDRVAVLVCESRVQVSRLEGMLAVGVDGCKQVRQILDACVRERGARMIREGAVEKGVGVEEMEIDG
ncbi:Exosome non-catalytic core component [Diaporthe eres]|uniref:Exosome non-catalytic core component n=1 Tax=Diaporthe eres TaxID=83184 RepID=A0ABR1NUF6_DIAER